MDAESSFELIQRAQRGDETALNRLLERYRPRLRRWASGRLPRYARQMTDTEDLVQDTLLGTFRNIHTFENRGEWALQAYLRRAVMNRVRNELDRVQSRTPAETLPDDLTTPDCSPLEQAIGSEVFRRYEAALDRLGEVEREAVIARIELGCSYQEIALLLDKPTSDAARMAVTRGLARLAELMAASGFGE